MNSKVLHVKEPKNHNESLSKERWSQGVCIPGLYCQEYRNEYLENLIQVYSPLLLKIKITKIFRKSKLLLISSFTD